MKPCNYFISPKCKPIIINGKRYESIKTASLALGISQSSLSTAVNKLNRSKLSEHEVVFSIKTKFTSKKVVDNGLN